MFFNKNPKDASSFVEALDEPAFVFSLQGRPTGHNKKAKEMMEDGRLPFDVVPVLTEFVQVMDAILPIDGTHEFILGGYLYNYDARPFSDGTLVRFRPLKERDHILRLSTSLDNMPWGILTFDISGESPKMVYSNRGARDLMIMNSPAITGANVDDLFIAFGITDDLNPNIFGKEVSYYNFEKRSSSAPTSWFRFHFIPYRQGRSYCLIVIEDATENKKREGQYLQSQRLEALGQLAGGVAHDFNNILSIIDGYARIGRKTVQENPNTENCLDRITQAVERASAITSQLLTFGSHKIIHGEINDLGKIIEDQQALLGPLIDASINISLNIEHEILVEASPDQICQILINLCVNARDAMPDGGDIIIENGMRGESMAFLRVIDTGTGMSPEVQSKMFDPFFTTKDQGKSTGLGLSVVYGLVKDMHGEIDVITQPGAGTSITIWLPVVHEQRHAVQDDQDELSSVKFENLTVLVVEDEPDLLKILTQMLDDLGFSVLSAPNGNEALKLQQKHPGKIDFLLTDVVMPELNGEKLSSIFREHRPEAKIVFMSGYPAGGHMGRVPLPNNAILLAKPVKLESLISVLQKLALQKSQSWDDAPKPSSGRWRIG